MSSSPTRRLDASLGTGLLSFPVTHFKADMSFDEGAYREHLSWLTQFGPAGLFAAGGTGEFFSLSPKEVETVTRTAVAEIAGRVPVIGGVGYGTALAVEMAQAAERAGADGILILPPYLVYSEPSGLTAHIEAICRAVGISVIVYSRDNAIIDDEMMARLCDACPNLVGYKDGVGDIELIAKVHSRIGDRLVYIGGLPTAETFALPYLELGVTTYSSAIFNFLPDFAMDFYAAVRRRDRAAIDQALRDFVLPYIAIRDRARGYPVSIIKAGLNIVGRPAGSVRAPLCDLTEKDFEDLSNLVAAQQVVPTRAAVR